MCMSKEQKYWADACAVVVTSEPLVNPFTKPSSCVTPCAPQNHDAECENTPHENILPLFAAVEALRGEDGTYPTNIEIKDGILNITLNDGTVLTTDGSTLVTGDYVDNAVKPYICSFTERDLWRVLDGASFTLSKEDTDAICYNPKGVRVLFKDDLGLSSGMVLSCGHYYSDILILLIGEHIYYMSTTMIEDGRLVMKSGDSVDITKLATQKEVGDVLKVANAKQDAINDLAAIRSGASKGATAVQPASLAKVATSGSYNDLSNKPTIPSAVTESTVSGWGFTKNTGTYSKPSGGIPKSDLASDVRTSLSKADTALQDYTEQYRGTVEAVDANEQLEDPAFDFATQGYVDSAIKNAIISALNTEV